jgi:hypothetical protein
VKILAVLVARVFSIFGPFFFVWFAQCSSASDEMPNEVVVKGNLID